MSERFLGASSLEGGPMSTRYYSLTACEHGEWNVHATEPGILKEDGSLDRDKVCPGGQRRELTGVQVVGYGHWAMKGLAVTVSDYHRRYAIIPLDE